MDEIIKVAEAGGGDEIESAAALVEAFFELEHIDVNVYRLVMILFPNCDQFILLHPEHLHTQSTPVSRRHVYSAVSSYHNRLSLLPKLYPSIIYFTVFIAILSDPVSGRVS